MQTALNAQKMGDPERAQALYEAVLQRAPDTFDALHMLGVIEMEFGNLDRAEDLITRAMSLLTTREMRNNLTLLRDRKRSQEGMYSLRSVAAADAIALFASETPLLDSAGRLDSCLLSPQSVSGAILHVVIPGDVLNPGSNHVGTRLCDRYVDAGMAVNLWRNAQQGVPKVAAEGAKDIDMSANNIPDQGLLAVTGLDTSTMEWLPGCAAGLFWLRNSPTVGTSGVSVV